MVLVQLSVVEQRLDAVRAVYLCCAPSGSNRRPRIERVSRAHGLTRIPLIPSVIASRRLGLYGGVFRTGADWLRTRTTVPDRD